MAQQTHRSGGQRVESQRTGGSYPPGQQQSGGQQTGGRQVSEQQRFGGQQQAGGQQTGGQQTGGQQRFGGQQTGGQQRFGGQQAGRQQAGGQQQTGGQQFGGQQAGGQQQQVGGQQGGGQQGVTFGDAITGEMRVALMDFVRSAEVCEWCADQCIAKASPEMVECARLCRDVADLALVNVQLLSRQSPFGPGVVEDFVEAAEACAAECSQHPDAHCQECARVLRRAIRSSRELLESVGRGAPAQGQMVTQ